MKSILKKLPTFAALTMLKFRCRNNKSPAVICNQNNGENQICSLCDRNDVGDEFHVLLVYPFLEMNVKKLLGKYVFLNPNTPTVACIMSTKSRVKLMDLSKFVRIKCLVIDSSNTLKCIFLSALLRSSYVLVLNIVL